MIEIFIVLIAFFYSSDMFILQLVITKNIVESGAKHQNPNPVTKMDGYTLHCE